MLVYSVFRLNARLKHRPNDGEDDASATRADARAGAQQMSPAQQAAADELIAGPRKGVKGPFIALLRSPELLARAQKVGEYLRFHSALPARLSEFATLVVSRRWTQQFEWYVHVPLALKEGTSAATIAALRVGCRPTDMSRDEALVYDFTIELTAHHGVSDDTYGAQRRSTSVS